MKKITILVFLALLMFAGCKNSNTDDIQLNLKSISFNADITYYNENYAAECVINKYGGFTAKLTEPENLSGFTISYFDESCKIIYNDIVISNATNLLPQSCSVEIINEIFKDCQSGDIATEKGNYKVNGNLNGNRYILTSAPTGLPLSLEVPDFGMKVSFSNVTVINQ